VVYHPIPGARTWLQSNKLIATTNPNISKILSLGIKGMLDKKDVRLCENKTAKELLLRSLARVKPSLLESVGASIESEKIAIDKFFNRIPKTYFYFCRSTFLLDVLEFCLSEAQVLTDLIPDFSLKFLPSDQHKLLINSLKFDPLMWVPYIKYHTACPQAAVLRKMNILNDLPKKPVGFPGHYLIWTGAVKRFIKNLLNPKIPKDTENVTKSLVLANTLAFSLLQGVKRGCATVPACFLEKEICSHVEAMTTPPELEPFKEVVDFGEELYGVAEPGYLKAAHEYDLRVVFRDPIKETFGKSVSGFFRSSNQDFKLKPFEPSHNSCFGLSKSKGGAYVDIIRKLSLPLKEHPVIVKDGIKLNYSYEEPDMNNVMSVLREKHDSLIASANLLNEFDDLLVEVYDLKPRKGLKCFESHKNIANGYLRLNTEVIPLSEPLKVRIITKSESLETFVSKSLQKSMKLYLNQFSCFVLTTRPLVISDFRDTWSREQDILADVKRITGSVIDFKFDNHVSGDYKAATDKLNIHFTRLIFENYMNALHVAEEDKEVFRRVLYSQRLHYPKKYCKMLREKYPHLNVSTSPDGFEVDQQNGQLMGSILSFPVLCVANAIAYKMALEEYIQTLLPTNSKPFRVSAHRLPCLVNGDDIYFRCNDTLYGIWLKYITIAGFQLSVGKNYVHQNTFTINSQCFMYDKRTDLIEECTYLNVGLLIGRSKGGDSEETLPIWDLYNKIQRGAHNTDWVHSRFLHFHRDKIRNVSYKGFYNLFLPKILGGLDFIVPTPKVNVLRWSGKAFAAQNKTKVWITQRQRQMATYFHNILTKMHKEPVIGDTGLASITIVDVNKPMFSDPYFGEFSYISVKTGEDTPVGFQEPKLQDSIPRFMIHTSYENFQPAPVYRGIDKKVFFRFMKSDRYQGKVDWFGLEEAISGRYPYRVLVSTYPEPNTFESNFLSVIATQQKLEVLKELPFSAHLPSRTMPNNMASFDLEESSKRGSVVVEGPYGSPTPLTVDE